MLTKKKRVASFKMSSRPLLSSLVDKFSGIAKVPGDKSISHRSLILSSQVIGRSKITGLLESDDVINTSKALSALGVEIEKDNDVWYVDGVGIGGLSQSDEVLDMGNSGTGVRLMMGLVAPYPFTTSFTGDESLQKRPMGRVMKPLEKMGAIFQAREENLPPLSVKGSNYMVPITYELPVASAQVKSAILLAALNIPGKTTVVEPEATRDHTELMMKYLGVNIKREGQSISIEGQPELKAKDINVPADPSSAAFLTVAALIIPGAKITIKNVCVNPLRIGLYKTLTEMGAKISFDNEREEAGEKIADITVQYSKLKAVDVPAGRAPSMIDEYPILSVAAAFADGKTIMNGLRELRVKESDRLQVMSDGLTACGIKNEISGDSLIVHGSKEIKGGGDIKTHMDHRIAMSFLVMGMAAKKPIKVDDGSMINTSFPGFVDLMNSLGARIT